MIPALIFILLVAAVATVVYRRRDAPQRIRCCHGGQWPPDDLTQRFDAACARDEMERRP